MDWDARQCSAEDLMLVCHVIQLARHATIAAEIAEVGAAIDATVIESVGLMAEIAEVARAIDEPALENAIFNTLVDDPASVGDIVDAFLGEVMVEAASADAVADATIPTTIAAAIVETATAADTQDGTMAPSTITWDPASVTAVTLSGGNLVATNTGTTSTNQGAHGAAANGKSTGKYYFECKITTFTGGAGVAVGIGTTAATYAGISTAATLGAMCYVVGHNGTGTIFNDAGGNTGYSLGARTSGDTIGIAVDLINRKVWFRVSPSGLWENNGSHDPTNSVTGGGLGVPAGTIVPFVTFGSGLAGAAGVAGNVITANFGASAFVGAVPSGYTAGWPP